MMRITAVTLLVVLSCTMGIYAEALVTDRPDATESSSVVQPGSVQIEMGWLYTERDHTGEGVHELPGTLVRLGLVDRVELRLGWGGYIDEGTGGESGAADGEIGTKIYLLAADGSMPEIAFLGSLSVPFGDDGLTSDEIDPSFRFALSRDLSESVSAGVNVGMEWETGDDARTESAFIYTVAIGFALTETIGTYVEAFGDIGIRADDDAHSLDGGVTWLASENLQFDALAGIGVSGDADGDWFVGAGMSIRLNDLGL